MNPVVYILGGGITGLSCAYILSQKKEFEVKLFESEDHFGGLARNFGSDGWRFEYGPHNIHSHDDEILVFLKGLLNDEFRQRNIRPMLYIHGKKVDYPLKGLDSLTTLKPKDMVLTGLDFLFTRIRAFLYGINNTEYLDEWLIQRFGKRMHDIYFAPYVQKVWRTDTHEISNYVGEKRIPVMSIREMIMRQLGFADQKKMHAESGKYVKNFFPIGGSARITDSLAREAEAAGADLFKSLPLKKIVVNGERITELHFSGSTKTELGENRVVDVKDEDVVISTLPLDTLAQSIPSLPPEIITTSESLNYTGLVFLYLKIKGEPVFNSTWVYFSNDKLLFNRISEFKHDELKMAPPGHVSLCVEIPCDKGEGVWHMPVEELYKKVLQQINEYENLPEENVVGYFKKNISNAYPCFRVGFMDKLDGLFNYFNSMDNFLSIGRQGLFCYANIDQCIRMAFDTCKTLKRDPGKLKSLQMSLLDKFN